MTHINYTHHVDTQGKTEKKRNGMELKACVYNLIGISKI